MKTRADIIKMTVEDLALDLVHYDRKGDPELPRDEIEYAIENGELTADDIVGWFGTALKRYLK
jgi:hypothetical protein